MDTEVEEQEVIEHKVVHSKIGNLENVKRAFFSDHFDEFKNLIATQDPQFKYFSAFYIYGDDYNESPEFIVKNRNRGFSQLKLFENKRSYLLAKFVCYKHNSRTIFESYWVVNSNDDLEKIMEEEYSNFEFIEVSTDFVLNKFLESDNENWISVDYIH